MRSLTRAWLLKTASLSPEATTRQPDSFSTPYKRTRDTGRPSARAGPHAPVLLRPRPLGWTSRRALRTVPTCVDLASEPNGRLSRAEELASSYHLLQREEVGDFRYPAEATNEAQDRAAGALLASHATVPGLHTSRGVAMPRVCGWDREQRDWSASAPDWDKRQGCDARRREAPVSVSRFCSHLCKSAS